MSISTRNFLPKKRTARKRYAVPFARIATVAAVFIASTQAGFAKSKLGEPFKWTSDQALIEEILFYDGLDREGELSLRASNPKFTQITDRYGELQIKAGKFKVKADTTPWSSWWYPLWQRTLFDEGNTWSTLGRYDTFVKSVTGTNPDSKGFEEKNIYDSRAVGWAGLCNAWALASILFPEPTENRYPNRYIFRVRDQKALLIKMLEDTEGVEIFGQRNDGRWDSVYADIFPEQFHRFLQYHLFENKTPFIMDHDAGTEVWNVPAYQAQTHITPDQENQNLFHVKTWVFTASPHVQDYDFVGTKKVIRRYSYDLYGERAEDGTLKVDFGKWTEESRWEHPDYLIPRPTSIVHKSFNEKIKNKYVKMIVGLE